MADRRTTRVFPKAMEFTSPSWRECDPTCDCDRCTHTLTPLLWPPVSSGRKTSTQRGDPMAWVLRNGSEVAPFDSSHRAVLCQMAHGQHVTSLATLPVPEQTMAIRSMYDDDSMTWRCRRRPPLPRREPVRSCGQRCCKKSEGSTASSTSASDARIK
jgi:hypothetical protein